MAGTILGALLGYLAVQKQAESERIRRRRSIATALRFDYSFHRTSVLSIGSEQEIPTPRFSHKTHDMFMAELGLFQPTTVYAVLMAKRVLDVLEDYCKIVRTFKDPSGDGRAARTTRSTAVLLLPLIANVMAHLREEGAVPGELPESIDRLVKTAQEYNDMLGPDEPLPLKRLADEGKL